MDCIEIAISGKNNIRGGKFEREFKAKQGYKNKYN